VTDPTEPESVSFSEAAKVWAKIGLTSFGGPAGQIAMMHEELVRKRRWISEERFLHALAYCMLLPGPEAQQLATYVGWLMHKTRGGLVAGTLFVLPGFVTMLGLAAAYATFHALGPVAALFFGLRCAVLALVVEALLRVAKRALSTRAHVGIAVAAFVLLFAFAVPFPLVLVLAGASAYGLDKLGMRLEAEQKAAATTDAPPDTTVLDVLARKGMLAHTAPSLPRTLRVLTICGLVWAAPIALAALAHGRGSVLVTEGTFFSKTAVMTFGGAYAVLSYIAQEAVSTYHWLSPGEMLDALGLAETTPGPLILVVEMVGFLGAYRNPGAFSPLVAGTLGACMTTWVTFVPCFTWIFVGGPYIEKLRGYRPLRIVLSAVTAAVVGVIGNLSLWFALHTLFRVVDERVTGPIHWIVPSPSTLDPRVAGLALLAGLALFRWKWSVPKTLAVTASCGMALHFVLR
jgi:chromate transporter